MTEWFEEWFGEEYLHLYPHRNDADARRMVQLLQPELNWRPGWRVLDVGCGAGRHLAAFEALGLSPVGVDLSASLLVRAREVSRAPLLRADMRRLPVRPGSMDLTVNLFTSFGYFSTDADSAAALADMLATVRPGGWFVLDFLNAPTVRADLVPEESTSLGGAPVRIRRALTEEGRRVEKTITLPDGRQFVERVRLFDPEELETLLRPHPFRVQRRFGDYAGGPLAAGSPRAILLARRV